MTPLGAHLTHVSTRDRPPRLVARFAVLTALGLAAAAAAILVVVQHTDTVQAQRQALSRAQLATTGMLTQELRAADLSEPASGTRLRELDRFFRKRILSEGIRGATVYGADGRATFATDGGVIGRRGPERPLREALAGMVVSDVAPATDGSRVLRAYVPVALGPTRAAGVVALEQDYAPIEAAARRSSLLIAGVLEAVLLLLCLIFVPVLARVATRIRRHVAELEHVATHDELTDLPNRLGFRRGRGFVPGVCDSPGR